MSDIYDQDGRVLKKGVGRVDREDDQVMALEHEVRELKCVVEVLTKRLSKAVIERDEYDKRRRQAMAKVEEWRGKYHSVNDRLKGFQKDLRL